MADCEINIAIIYKKLGFWNKALDMFNSALSIRKDLIGPLSLPVADIQEHIGKLLMEVSKV